MKRTFLNIEALLDNIPIDYEVEKLENETINFKVDYRYRIRLFINDTINVHRLRLSFLFLKKEDVRVIQETGQDLFAVSFYYRGGKLCIGTVGDLPGLKYVNDNDSIELIGKFPNHLWSFYLSYVSSVDERTEISSWLAVDSTI